MKIGDMLNVVGALPLSQFEWGEALVKLCNQELAEHVVNNSQLLTAENTGEDARSALYRLPAIELAQFIVLDFDPGSQTVLNEEPVAPVAIVPSFEPAAPVTPPPPTPETPVKKPVKTKPSKLLKGLAPTAKSRLALAMGASLVVIALLLAVAMSVTTVKEGQMPDSKALESVVRVLGEAIKLLLQVGPPVPA